MRRNLHLAELKSIFSSYKFFNGMLYTIGSGLVSKKNFPSIINSLLKVNIPQF
jgi:hypothetical protein